MRFRSTLLWLLLGMLVAGLPLLVELGRSRYHYSEIDTFFKGSLDDKQVVGISFIEYKGFGFIAGTNWKAQLINPDRARITVYEKSSVFQENVPHQPSIEIKDGQIHLDDGEEKLVISVQRSDSKSR
jgi:hypothetical protein